MALKSINEIKELNPEQLIEELKTTQKKLVDLKFKKSVDRITDTSEFRKLRKYIAKIMTILQSKKIVKVEPGAQKK